MGLCMQAADAQMTERALDQYMSIVRQSLVAYDGYECQVRRLLCDDQVAQCGQLSTLVNL